MFILAIFVKKISQQLCTTSTGLSTENSVILPYFITFIRQTYVL
ncbi:hypothetical protein D357_02739 [Enterococcus faecium SD3B-2]|nr:hypothetical protein D357_02739 [Enterococcus faecium SD3B-2]